MNGRNELSFEHTRTLADAATGGPWAPSRDARKGGPFLNVIADPRKDGWRERVATALNPADAEFIAHARTAVPVLVAAVERVQALHFQYLPAAVDFDCCAHCNQNSGGYVEWPCPTIRALETR